MMDAALDFVDALGLTEVDLLGWSMAGFVVLSMALARPGLVRRLVVAGSKPGPVPDAPAPAPEVRPVAGKAVNDAEDLLFLFFPDDPAGREAGLASLARLPDMRAEVSADALGAQSAALMSWSTGAETAWPRLKELTMPILVSAGAQDRLMDAYHSYAMVRRLPNVDVVIYGDAAHAFLFQHADRFAREILAFLRPS